MIIFLIRLCNIITKEKEKKKQSFLLLERDAHYFLSLILILIFVTRIFLSFNIIISCSIRICSIYISLLIKYVRRHNVSATIVYFNFRHEHFDTKITSSIISDLFCNIGYVLLITKSNLILTNQLNAYSNCNVAHDNVRKLFVLT